MPRKVRVFNLYTIADYKRWMRTGEQIYAIGTTYAKTVRGAMKTFVENHIGDFIIEHDNKAEVVTLGNFYVDFNVELPKVIKLPEVVA